MRTEMSISIGQAPFKEKADRRENKEGGEGGEDDERERVKTQGHQIAQKNRVPCIYKLHRYQPSYYYHILHHFPVFCTVHHLVPFFIVNLKISPFLSIPNSQKSILLFLCSFTVASSLFFYLFSVLGGLAGGSSWVDHANGNL